MSVVRSDNSKKMIAAFLVLVLSVMACNQPIPTKPTTTVLTTPSAKPASTMEPDNTPAWTALVELPTVNVRAEPGGEVVGVLRAGDTVIIIQCDGSWCKIKKPAGYVWRGCLSDNPKNLGCTAK